jgi:hypothetical protein
MCAGAGGGRIAELAVLRERERARGAREGESESERERMSLASADPTLAPQSRPEFTNYIDDEGRRRGAAITSLSRLKHVIAPTPVWRGVRQTAASCPACRNYMPKLFISRAGHDAAIIYISSASFVASSSILAAPLCLTKTHGNPLDGGREAVGYL